MFSGVLSLIVYLSLHFLQSQWNTLQLSYMTTMTLNHPITVATQSLMLVWTKHPLSGMHKALPDAYTSQCSATHICSKPLGFRKSLNRSVPLCIWIQPLNQYTKCGQFKLSIFQKPRQKFRENFLYSDSAHICWKMGR